MRCALPLPFRRAKLSGRRLLPWGETASGAAAGLRRSGFHPVAVPEQVRGRVALGPMHAPQDWGRALDRTGPAVDRAAVGLAEVPAAVELAAQPVAVELAALPAAVELAAPPAVVELAAQPAAVGLAGQPAAVGLAGQPAAVGLAGQPAVVELAALPAAGFAAAAGFAEPVVVGPAAGLV